MIAPAVAGGEATRRSWQAKVAALLRAEGQGADTASVIEAVRLSIALASLRGFTVPGLAEMRDATLAALCVAIPRRFEPSRRASSSATASAPR